MKSKKAFVRALLGAALAVASASSSAGGTPPPDAQAWAAIGKLPDFSGVWELVFARGGPPPEAPALTPEYAAKLKAYQDEQARGGHQDNTTANCLPPGMPQIMNQPYPMEFLVTPGKITIAIEAYSQMRRIFTDGRKHPDDPDLTFNGHSIGHWEGDTLVVDTVGFVPETPLGQGGLQHSDKMRIEERFRITAPDRMEIRTTVYDPVALTKPWTTVKTLARHRDWDIAEYVCEQNNRNFVNDEGKAGIILNK
ncbi:MAG TPA: hypothetical protein VG994_01725 [Steroidobacteraceae bacterium]|nr:hypothetical protein [Steroidobacteraceae bacterium]